MNGRNILVDCPWTFLLPAGFDPVRVLPPWHRKRADEARYFVSLTIHKQLAAAHEADDHVRLHSKILERVMNWRCRREVIASLVECGVIECDMSYSVGFKCRSYRLGHDYLDETLVRVPPTDPKMIEKLARLRRELMAEQECRRLPIHDALNQIQHECLSVCSHEAERILRDLEPQTRFVQRALINNIRERRMTNSVSTTRRWFNALTGIKRELRAALRINGQRLANVDLTASQPALLVLFARLHDPTFERGNVGTYKVSRSELVVTVACDCGPAFSAELNIVERLVVDGRFYDFFESRTRLPRASVKLRFIADVLAPKPRFQYPSPVRDCFRDSFPLLAKFIKDVNHFDHATLIRELQRLEAWLVVETVAPKLIGRCPIVTLHDAAYCAPGDIGLVQRAFTEAFKEIGFEIALKTELPSKSGSIAA